MPQPFSFERFRIVWAKGLSPFLMRSRILDFISEAAFFVKVMATISSGTSTIVRSFKYRSVSNLVLPEPAGASTINERKSRALCLNWMSLIASFAQIEVFVQEALRSA